MWQSHVMNTFPELASQLLFPGGGTYVTGRGDALLIQSCAVITDYQVFWNQSLDNLCYKLFPVQLNTSGSLQMRFLELSTRRLLNNSHTIPCATREPFYIRDYANDFWKYDLKDGFTLTEIKGFVTRNTYVPLPKIATFNDRIVRHGTFSPHPTTLLSIVAAQERSLQQLEDIRSSGHGNVLKGIAAGMSDAFDAVVHAGENIFSTVTRGFESTTNSTTEVVGAIAFDIKSILTFAGTGVSGLFLYGIDLCIVIYLFYMHRRNIPPPIPPRQHTAD